MSRLRAGSADGRASSGSLVRTVWLWDERRPWLVLVLASTDEHEAEHELSTEAVRLDLDTAGSSVAIWIGDELVTFPSSWVGMILDCVGIFCHRAGLYDLPDSDPD